MSGTEMEAALPEAPGFGSPEELGSNCREMGFALASGGATTLEEFRVLVVEFYDSGALQLGGHPLFEFIWRRRREVAARCPLVVLQLLVLRIEALLFEVFVKSSVSRDRQLTSFNEASALHGEFSMLDRWLASCLGLSEAPRLGWPLQQGWARIQRYYDMLWNDAHASEDAWAVMEKPGLVSDEVYHAAFADVAEVLGDLGVEWWPCRGTLIALLRHGRRSGRLSRGLVDVVERDIDIMLGVPDERAWDRTAEAIESALVRLGWVRCWSKTSVDLASQHRDSARRDLLYCVRTSPVYMLLDVTSYVTGGLGGDTMGDLFVHRLCRGKPVDGTTALAVLHEAASSGGCEVLEGIGPLRPGAGRLRRDAVHPLAWCRAAGRAVPCPREPLETIRAMVHSGLDAACVALPTTVGRDPDDPYTMRLAEEGLTAEDVRILADRSARLRALGFLSMEPFFGECRGVTLVPTSGRGGGDGQAQRGHPDANHAPQAQQSAR